jgi:CDP-diacylglycerol--glycerol-3-phosphate 3-phosphatidyltransferase
MGKEKTNKEKGKTPVNYSNALTVLRIFFIPYYLIFLFSKYRHGATIALFIFILASLTDWYDGKIARKRGEVTEFGRIMDPIADKLLVLSAFISFVQLELVPTWMIIIMIAREFIITSLRMVAISNSGKVLDAISSGKHKTVWHIVTIITILVILALPEIAPWKEFLISKGDAGEHILAFIHTLPYAMTFICVVYSVYSAIDFIRKNKDYIFGR